VVEKVVDYPKCMEENLEKYWVQVILKNKHHLPL